MDTCSHSMYPPKQQLFLQNPNQYRLCCVLRANGKIAFIALPNYGPILNKNSNTHARAIIRPQWFSFFNLATQSLQTSNLECSQATTLMSIAKFPSQYLIFLGSITYRRYAFADARTQMSPEIAAKF